MRKVVTVKLTSDQKQYLIDKYGSVNAGVRELIEKDRFSIPQGVRLPRGARLSDAYVVVYYYMRSLKTGSAKLQRIMRLIMKECGVTEKTAHKYIVDLDRLNLIEPVGFGNIRLKIPEVDAEELKRL